jgi:hypothetical protein
MFDDRASESETALFLDTTKVNELLNAWIVKQERWKTSSIVSASRTDSESDNSRRALKMSILRSPTLSSSVSKSSGVKSQGPVHHSSAHDRIVSHIKQHQQHDKEDDVNSGTSATELYDQLLNLPGSLSTASAFSVSSALPPKSSSKSNTGTASGRLNINLEPTQELPKYQALFSLLFTETEYVSFFQSKQQSTALKTFPAQDFQFFAYEALIDEAFQRQMKMLLVDYQEVDALMEFYRLKRHQIEKSDEKSGSIGGKEKEIKAKLEVLSTQPSSIWSKLLVFTQQWTADHLMTHRLQCAFGSTAHWIHPDLVMCVLPSVKLFYAKYPEILERVKPIVRQGVEAIGLDPEQMHFMYKL